MKVEHNKRT